MRNVPCVGSYIRVKQTDHTSVFKVIRCEPECLVAIAVHPSGDPMAGAEAYPWTFAYGEVIDISDEFK